MTFPVFVLTWKIKKQWVDLETEVTVRELVAEHQRSGNHCCSKVFIHKEQIQLLHELNLRIMDKYCLLVWDMQKNSPKNKGGIWPDGSLQFYTHVQS